MLVQLSDFHLGTDGSAQALTAAVERVRALRNRPEAVLVSGDVAEHGAEAEYALARELLAPLGVPVHLLAGNHDRFAERTEYAVRCGDLRLVVCDTSIPGRDEGALDVGALEERLAENPQAPTIMAMHHPPVPIGIPFADRIGLPSEDRAALAALLRRAPQVRRVVAGHVHRTVLGSLGGVPVVTCSSTSPGLQGVLELGGTTLEVTREPPSFLVHALVDGELVTHVQPI